MIPPKSQQSSSLRAFLQEEERVHLVDISFALVVQILHMCKGTGTSQGGSTPLASVRVLGSSLSPRNKTQ